MASARVSTPGASAAAWPAHSTRQAGCGAERAAVRRSAHQEAQHAILLLTPLQRPPQLLLSLVDVALARDDETTQRSGLVTSHDQVIRKHAAGGRGAAVRQTQTRGTDGMRRTPRACAAAL